MSMRSHAHCTYIIVQFHEIINKRNGNGNSNDSEPPCAQAQYILVGSRKKWRLRFSAISIKNLIPPIIHFSSPWKIFFGATSPLSPTL